MQIRIERMSFVRYFKYKRTFDFLRRALARQTNCFCPADKLHPLSPTSPSNPPEKEIFIRF